MPKDDCAYITLRMADEEAILDLLDRMQEGAMIPWGVAVYEASSLDMPGGRASPRNFILKQRGEGVGRELWPVLDPALKDEYERRKASRRLREGRHAKT